MNAEGIVRSLRVLWRADRILAEIQLRRMAVGLISKAFAALFAAFGVLMLELAAYFALVQVWTAIIAAVVLGAVNFVLAGIIVAVASRAGDSREYDMAMGLHNSAVETLQLQAKSFDLARSTTHGFETILPALLVPAVGLLVRTLRRAAAKSSQ